MLSRRAILAFLGLAPVAAVAAQLPAQAAEIITVSCHSKDTYVILPPLTLGHHPLLIQNLGIVPLRVQGSGSEKSIPRGEAWTFDPTAKGWELNPLKRILA